MIENLLILGPNETLTFLKVFILCRGSIQSGKASGLLDPQTAGEL